MKKGFLTILLLIITSLPTFAASNSTSGSFNTTVSGFANFSTACSSNLTLGKTIVVDTTVTVNNKTISGRSIRVIRGGIIHIGKGKTLAVNGLIEAGPYQIFTGDGTVTGLASAVPEWFGAVGNGTSDDSPVIKKTIAAVKPGGSISMIHAQTAYKIDNSGGLTSAIVIDKPISIRIDSTVVGTTGGIKSNPPYIFKITGNNVILSGNGVIKYAGTSDDSNSGNDSTMPGLIYVTGNKVHITGLTFDTPPKVGIEFYNANDGVVENCRFIGGVSSYTTGNTALFGVRIYGGSRHKIINNFAGPDTAGKKIICLVFSSGSASNLIVSGNHAEGVYEKIGYLNGSNNIMSNNFISSNAKTSPYRVVGSHNKIIGNTAIDCYGGAQATDGTGNSIIGNTFVGCIQAGIVVSSTTTGVTGTVIENNYVTGTGTASKKTNDGIQVYAQHSDAFNVSVQGNTVKGFLPTEINSLSGIRLQAVKPYFINDSIVANNIVENTLLAINMVRVVNSKVANNQVITSRYGVLINGGDRNTVSNNQSRDISGYSLTLTGEATNIAFLHNRSINPTNIGISGITATPTNGNYGMGNQYTDAPIVGKSTLTATASTNVTHGGVAANAFILLAPANTAAARLSANKGLLTGISGNDFLIKTGDGAATGTEVFNWQIVQ